MPGTSDDGVAVAPAVAARQERVLETMQLVKAFGGLVAVNKVDFHAERERDRRPHRPQRRRQDDVLQRDHRHLPARPTARSRSTATPSAACCPPRSRKLGHRAHLPEHPPVPRDDGARERHGRPALPLAHEHAARSSRARPGAMRAEQAVRDRACELLDYVGLGGHGVELAKNLPYGEQRRLEIARALATEPALLLLDEPAAGMNPQETASLMGLIRKIRDEGHDDPAHRARHEGGHGQSPTASGAGPRREDRRGPARRGPRDPKVIEAYLGKGA